MKGSTRVWLCDGVFAKACSVTVPQVENGNKSGVKN